MSRTIVYNALESKKNVFLTWAHRPAAAGQGGLGGAKRDEAGRDEAGPGGARLGGVGQGEARWGGVETGRGYP